MYVFDQGICTILYFLSSVSGEFYRFGVGLYKTASRVNIIIWRREDLKRVCAIIFTSALGTGSIFFMTSVIFCRITAYSE